LSFRSSRSHVPADAFEVLTIPSFSDTSRSLRVISSLQSSLFQRISEKKWLEKDREAGLHPVDWRLCCVTLNVRPSASLETFLICGQATQSAAQSIFLNRTQTSRSLHFRVWRSTHSLPPRSDSTISHPLGSTWFETTLPRRRLLFLGLISRECGAIEAASRLDITTNFPRDLILLVSLDLIVRSTVTTRWLQGFDSWQGVPLSSGQLLL
jgi:hypothetical protein